MELKNSEVREIVLTIFAGVPKGEAIREAMLLALTEWRNVVFEFNGKPYEVSPERIINFYDEEKNNGGDR
ncbi:MAG: hypothetical protein JXA50_01615 [Deltaproteobacteria bacterium]|nr:hypothetical protein [Deltaproteobacteria bacterium]